MIGRKILVGSLAALPAAVGACRSSRPRPPLELLRAIMIPEDRSGELSRRIALSAGQNDTGALCESSAEPVPA